MAEHEDDPVYRELAAAPDAVLWTMSAAGAITYVSPSVEQVRGFTPEEAMAQSADEIHPPQSLAVSLAYFERYSRDLLDGRIPAPFHDKLEYRCKDGSTVWCDAVAVPVVADDGTVTELRGVSAPLP